MLCNFRFPPLIQALQSVPGRSTWVEKKFRSNLIAALNPRIDSRVHITPPAKEPSLSPLEPEYQLPQQTPTMEPQTAKSPMYLFGGSKPWTPPAWTSSDDRVRGGSSSSQLLLREHPSQAIFRGHLDTTTLGGAGFASQRTRGTLALDLLPYRGLVLDIAQSDGKTYTLILKDEILPLRPDGREQSGLSWEADFKPATGGQGGEAREEEGPEKVFLRWQDFKPMYRGREKEGARRLRRGEVKRVSVMCRSFFGEQEGDFELTMRSIAAVKEELESPYRDDPDRKASREGVDEKRSATVPARDGWLGWVFGVCVKL